MTAIDLPLPLDADAHLPVSFSADTLDTPAIIADLDIVDENIRRMAEFSARNSFGLRPHIKTHKSVAMARRQVAAGAVGICTATVTEAAAMVAGGIRDVLIAYPLVGPRKLKRLVPLFEEATVTLVADSRAVIESYAAFAERLGRVVTVLIEIDSGMGRIGARPAEAVALAQVIARSGTLALGGIMTHAGQTHDVTALVDIMSIARREAAIMGGVREDLERAGFAVPVVSAGSSITAPYFRPDDGITEVRPGTYIYNDLRTLALYACTLDSLAVTALATVVSIAGDRVTIDAGSKTLTVTRDAAFGFGLLTEDAAATFTRMSEEHGVLAAIEGEARFKVGQRVRVLPVHVCVWMDLQPEIYGCRGGQIVERVSVDAMRHSL